MSDGFEFNLWTLQLINKIMQTLSPAPVIQLLLDNLSNANWRVREEIVNIVILALSSFAPGEFDFALLTRYNTAPHWPHHSSYCLQSFTACPSRSKGTC